MPPVVDQTIGDFPFHPHLTGHPVIDHHFWPSLPLPPMFNHFAALSGTPFLPLTGANNVIQTGITGSLCNGSSTTDPINLSNLTASSTLNKPQLSMPTFRALLSQYVLANGNLVVDNEQDEERSNTTGSPECNTIYNTNNNTKNDDVRLSSSAKD